MPFVIDLLRHGHAEPNHPDGDEARPVSPRGREALATLGDALRRERWAPTVVLVSPLRRAGETARLVLERAGVSREPAVIEELMPDRNPEDAARVALEHAVDGAHVLLVGHQPQMGLLARVLSGTETAPGPGDLARIEFRDGNAAGRGRLTRVISVPPPRG